MFETVLTIKGSIENAYDAHRQVWDLIRGGKDKNADRDFLFTVMNGEDYSYIKVRAESFEAAGIPAMPVQRPVLGRTYRATVLYSMHERYIHFDGGVVSEDRIERQVRSRMSEGGMEVADFSISFGKSVQVSKPGGDKWTLRTPRVTALVTITNEEAAMRLLRSGIGRSRAFGFGMIELVEVRNG